MARTKKETDTKLVPADLPELLADEPVFIPYWSRRVRMRFTEEVLGTAPNNQQLHRDYIASKAPDAALAEEEIDAIGVDAYTEKGMTVFPRDKDGNPFVYDYQMKGFFKESCKALKKKPGTYCAGIKAYKSEIDLNLFVYPRIIPLNLPDGAEVGRCQRPLRASTPMGERIALSDSETVPAGTWMEIEIRAYTDSMGKLAMETLAFGREHGFGQWRNSGKGRFDYELLSKWVLIDSAEKEQANMR